eukprot:9082112-Alexandrium_andersonii.AAC.1
MCIRDRSPEKCRTVTLWKAHRQTLKRHHFERAGPIRVVLSMRDLGAHIGGAAKLLAPTLTARMKKGAQEARRAATLGVDRQ